MHQRSKSHIILYIHWYKKTDISSSLKNIQLCTSLTAVNTEQDGILLVTLHIKFMKNGQTFIHKTNT